MGRWLAIVGVMGVVMGLVMVVGAGASPAQGKAEFKIGLIVSGSTADGGWNQLARKALEEQAKAVGAKLTVSEKVNPSKAADEMRDYASRGYDLVVGHGYEFTVPAGEVATASGKTKFAVSGSPDGKANVATLNFNLAQACYQLGVVGARVSKTGKLGFIGGSEIPSLIACYNGFAAGARSVRAEVTVVKAYTSWDRPELSKSQTEAFINQGVDVILQNVDAASRGVFEAVKEYNVKEVRQVGGKQPPVVYVFGTNADQNDNAIAGAWTLASAVIKLDVAFGRVIKEVQAGEFKAGVREEDLANGVCVAVLNPKLVEKGVITKAVQEEVDAAGKKLASGEVKVQ